MMRSKLLVAFRPEVLDALDDWLAAPYSTPPLIEEAWLAVRQAKALYAGQAPGIRLANPGELSSNPSKEVE